MEDGFARQVSMDTWRPIGGVIPFFDRAIWPSPNGTLRQAIPFIRLVDVLFPGSTPRVPLISCTGGAAQPGLIPQ